MHIELLSFSATAPGATGAAAAAVVGDSLTIKNNRGSSEPRIIDLWGLQQTSGFAQLTWPTGHDTTRGYRYGVEAGDTYSLLPKGTWMPLTPQEQISATIAGSATAGDVELGCIAMWYPDLPGIDQHFLLASQLRIEEMTTVFCTLAGIGTAAGGYGVGELINAESDLLKANRDYALLGMTTTVDCAAVWIAGPDTGNVRVGCPGADQNTNENANYFLKLAAIHEKKTIPVINSGNKNSTTIGILSDENAVNVIATLYLALLPK